MVEQVQVFSNLQWNDFWYLASAAMGTIVISGLSIALGTLIGIGLGWLLSSVHLFFVIIVDAVLDVFRSVPLIIQLLLFNTWIAIIGYPQTAFVAGTIVLTFYTAAQVTMIVRGAIASVPKEIQIAARSLGMTYLQKMRHIIWPLGLRAVFPAWIGIALSVMKDSALVSVINYTELTRAFYTLNTKTQETFLLLTIVGAFYFALSYPISLYSTHIEKRWKS